MNDSEVFPIVPTDGGGTTIPLWESPMQLKHLDMVRSDIDGEFYTLLNNNPVESTITVGPGDPATALAAWLAGWRKVGDGDKPGDIITIRDVGNTNFYQSGVKTYLRTGVILEVLETDYPGLPSDAFSIMNSWKVCAVQSPPATVSTLSFGSPAGITSGAFKGYMIACSAASSAVADVPKTWYSADGGSQWYAGPTIGTTSNFNARLCSNEKNRFYRCHAGDTNIWSIDPLGAGIESSWTQRGSHGLTLAANFAVGTFEYLGEIAGSDCLCIMDGSAIPTGGSSTAVAFSVNSGLGFSRPTLFGMNASIKGSMILTNKQGHVLMLAATKTTSPLGVQIWASSAYGGTMVDTFQSTTYYNVCGGCWDGEKYVIALMRSGSVDIFTGYIQGDGSVVFTMVSKSNMNTYITGDGHKNSGNGIYYSRGQYLFRLTNKLTIFPSFGAMCDATPTAIVPLQTATVLNSVGFAQIGDLFHGFVTNTPWKSQLTIGTTTPFKPTPETVSAVRVR